MESQKTYKRTFTLTCRGPVETAESETLATGLRNKGRSKHEKEQL